MNERISFSLQDGELVSDTYYADVKYTRVDTSQASELLGYEATDSPEGVMKITKW